MKKNKEAPHPNITQKEMDALARKCEQYLDGWKRAQADYNNLEKEYRIKSMELITRAKETALEELLPVVDHYERAIAHIPKDMADKEWVQGFAHIKKQFDTVLENMGLKKIQSIGESFNHEIHEAVGAVPSEKDEQVIVEEIQPGYTIGDRVIRHAKVVVSNGNH